VRIVEVEAFAVALAPDGNALVGAAGLIGTRSSDARYARVLPYRPLFSTNTETVLVRIRTDDGTVGWGESQAPVAGDATALLVKQLLAPILVGQDPRDVAVLADAMYDGMRDRGHGGGFMLDAIAGADTALWDICGKHYGQPVARMLGGAYRNAIPIYLSGPRGATVEERIHDAQSYVERGFSAVKLFIGRGVREDLDEVEQFRRHFGDELKLLVDAQWMYSRAEATTLGRGLQELGVYLFETPIDSEDVAGHAALAGSLDLAIALGETERTRWQVRPYLEQAAVDVLQPDVGRSGITETRRIAALAEVYNIPIALHCGVGFGPYIAATLQLAAAIPNFVFMEYQPEMQEIARVHFGADFQIKDGHLLLPQEPGLGIAAPPQSLLDAGESFDSKTC
jgi:L-alanine-DL-glutamate epimerase-like enolase superfamily enzyme